MSPAASVSRVYKGVAATDCAGMPAGAWEGHVAYEEVEQRKGILLAIEARLRTTDGTLGIDAEDVYAMGQGLGLDRREALRLFQRLLREGYLDARLLGRAFSETSGRAAITDLTDKGLRAINRLPADDPIAGLTAVLEEYLIGIEADPDLSQDEKARKRGVVRQVLGSVRAFALEIGPKIAAEVLLKGMLGS